MMPELKEFRLAYLNQVVSVPVTEPCGSILVVDDNEIARSAVSHLLRRSGYAVLQASCGAECLDLAEEHRPDLILLDLKMPDINGVEVLRQLRANPKNDGICIVYLSAQAGSERAAINSLAQGADGYIRQPVENDELLSKVRGFLGRNAADESLRASEHEGSNQVKRREGGAEEDQARLQSELARRNIELEKLKRIRDTIVGMASHDLRKPLSGILMTASLLLESDPPPGRDQSELLHSIKDASRQVIQQLDDLIDAAHIEAGTLRVEKRLIDLVPLLAARISQHQRSAEVKGITLRAELQPGAPQLLADPERIEQIVNGLIVLAIRHTHRHGMVSVRFVREGETALLSVASSGAGLTDEEMRGLAVSFHDSEMKSAGGEQSPRLAMAIIKALTDAHEATVSVDTHPDQGFVVKVSFPIP